MRLIAAIVLALSLPAPCFAAVQAPPEEEVVRYDASDILKIKRMATAGYTLSIIGLGTMVASWTTYFPDVGKQRHDLSPAWIVLMASWGAVSMAAIPLLNAASYQARRIMDYPPVDGFFIAGWVMLIIGYGAVGFIEKQPVYTMLYATVGYTAATFWCWAGTGRSMHRLKRFVKEQKTLVAPMVAPLPGGAMIGATGLF